MTNAYRDENSRTTLISASQDDGETIVRITSNPTNHSLGVDDNTTGTDNGNHGGVALIDENGVSAITALSSDGDGTIIELYADPATGKLLIDSN